MKAKFLKVNKGQMMIEMMVALSILVVGVLGMVGLLNRSLGLNKIVTSQYVASNLAMEGIESIKNIIDHNFIAELPFNQNLANGSYEVDYNLSLTSYSDRFLRFDDSTGIYGYSSGNDSPYKRKITIETIPNSSGEYDQIKVNSIVSWKIRGFSNTINAEDHFFNWREGSIAPPTPGCGDLICGPGEDVSCLEDCLAPPAPFCGDGNCDPGENETNCPADCSTPPPGEDHSLSVSVLPGNWGSVSLSPSGGTYVAGTVVTLTATAGQGYVFSSWSGALSGSNNPTTITIDSDKSVTANFALSGQKTKITLGGRWFYYQTPSGGSNLPVIIVLHGGGQTADDWFGTNEQSQFVQSAKANYVIIAPDSGVPSYSSCTINTKQWYYEKDWTSSNDFAFFNDLFSWISSRSELNSSRVYATGISSGGFMTSRLARYFGTSKLKAIAVHSSGDADSITHEDKSNLKICKSGSGFEIAQCGPVFNDINSAVNSNHPATLIIHGNQDGTVSVESANHYFDELNSAGITVSRSLKVLGCHLWFDDSGQKILDWFNSHK